MLPVLLAVAALAADSPASALNQRVTHTAAAPDMGLACAPAGALGMLATMALPRLLEMQQKAKDAAEPPQDGQ